MELREQGEIELVGLIQEQHPDRCSLYLQWKEMDFPILVDSLNRIGVSAVPMLWAIDEFGVVRNARPDPRWVKSRFLQEEYEEPDGVPPQIEEEEGVASYLDGDWPAAIEFWEERVAGSAEDAKAWFRLGCAYRARFDCDERESGDFQKAVSAWTRALALRPNNYIWRRRVQQYGPTLDKPYPFYDWVDQARNDLVARGEEPHPLVAEPHGAELAGPARSFQVAGDQVAEPDASGRIQRDEAGLVVLEIAVTPCPVKPGASACIALVFTPDKGRSVHWTNDAGPLQVALSPAAGLRSSTTLLTAKIPSNSASSPEERILDFEVMIPDSATDDLDLTGYALYYVCEGEEGACVYRRQDFKVRIPVRSKPGSLP